MKTSDDGTMVHLSDIPIADVAPSFSVAPTPAGELVEAVDPIQIIIADSMKEWQASGRAKPALNDWLWV